MLITFFITALCSNCTGCFISDRLCFDYDPKGNVGLQTKEICARIGGLDCKGNVSQKIRLCFYLSFIWWKIVRNAIFFFFPYTLIGVLDEDREDATESVDSSNREQGIKTGLTFFITGFILLGFGIIILFILSRVF